MATRNNLADHAPGEVTVVGSRKAGYRWRILDEDGTPVQARPGKFLSLDVVSPEGKSAYEASLKAVDMALRKLADERAKAPRKSARAALSKRGKRLALARRRKGADTEIFGD